MLGILLHKKGKKKLLWFLLAVSIMLLAGGIMLQFQ